MTTEVLAKARSRWSNAEGKFGLNEIGDLQVAQGLPPYTEMTRRGKGWQVITTSAAASLVVRPDTTALITLWNGEGTGNGKSYIIDRIFSHMLVSDDLQGRFMLWACVHPQGMTKPTADIARAATNLVGMSGLYYSGMAVVDIDATVVDNGWYPVSSSVDWEPTGVLPGAGIVANIEGRLIVPPQGGISIQVVASMAATATTCTGLSWYEEKLDLVL